MHITVIKLHFNFYNLQCNAPYRVHPTTYFYKLAYQDIFLLVHKIQNFFSKKDGVTSSENASRNFYRYRVSSKTDQNVYVGRNGSSYNTLWNLQFDSCWDSFFSRVCLCCWLKNTSSIFHLLFVRLVGWKKIPAICSGLNYIRLDRNPRYSKV